MYLHAKYHDTSEVTDQKSAAPIKEKIKEKAKVSLSRRTLVVARIPSHTVPNAMTFLAQKTTTFSFANHATTVWEHPFDIAEKLIQVETSRP